MGLTQYMLVASTDRFVRTSLLACDAYEQIMRRTRKARWTACHLSFTWRTVQRRFRPTHTKLSCEMEIEIMRTYCVNWCKIFHNQDGDTLFMLNILRSRQSYIWHKKKISRWEKSYRQQSILTSYQTGIYKDRGVSAVAPTRSTKKWGLWHSNQYPQIRGSIHGSCLRAIL